MTKLQHFISGEPVSLQGLDEIDILSLDPETQVQIKKVTGEVASVLAGSIDTRYENLKEYTLKNGNAELKVYPERGGLVSSLVLDGIEILYQDMLAETLHNPKKSVKGGIPILFPNSGPLTQEEKEASGFNLPQHGFARTNSFRLTTPPTKNHLKQILRSEDIADTFNYPFEGDVLNTIILDTPNSCLFEYKIFNSSQSPLPISLGFHPYFRVPFGDKNAISWNFEGGESIVQDAQVWQNDGTTEIDLAGDDEHIVQVTIPGIGNLEITTSPDLKKLLVRSLPGKDFVCIEPVQNSDGGLVHSPLYVAPGKSHTSFMRIILKK